MNTQFTVIPHVAVHPTKIVCYKKFENSRKIKQTRKFEHLLLSNKKNNGKVSDQAKRKVSRAVEYLLFMSNDKYLPDTAHGKNYTFKLSFITLTLPSSQIHPDNYIKENCLNQFFVEARRRWKVKNYVWRAEKQKNGNIHFHILSDKFIPWSDIRNTWNRIVNKYGYVDRYRDQIKAFHAGDFKIREDLLQKWSYKDQVKAYQKGKANDFSNPNSTDVHSLVYIHSVKNYIVKYCTKDESNNAVDGRLWGCSESLSNIKGGTDIVDSYVENEIHTLSCLRPTSFYHSDHFTVISISPQDLHTLNLPYLFEMFSCYMIQHFNFNIQSLIPPN